MTTYSHTTFAAAKTLLADLLGDPGKKFTVDAELGFALVEARRMWNLLTGQDRARGTVSAVDGQSFYLLKDVLLDAAAVKLREQTIRDRSVVSEIEYHLMEPQLFAGTWTGTDQFTLDQIVRALQRRRDQFLAETGCVVVEHNTGLIAGGSVGTIDLPDTVIGIKRAVFKTLAGRYYPLRIATERSATATNYRWHTHGVPTAYTVSTQPELTVQLTPPPAEPGYLETLVVQSGATLNPDANSSTGTLMGIPDDCVWGVKYGALADLYLSAGDPVRAEMCEQLYQLCVQFTVELPTILAAELDGLPVLPSALSQTDMQWGGWQSRNRASPTVLSVAGPDLIAMTPVPNYRQHSATLDVVRRAIVPVLEGDFIQIGRENLDALVGMAHHISRLKYGGNESAETQALAELFFRQAAQFDRRRSAQSTTLQQMRRSSSRETDNRPWERQPVTVEDRPEEVRSERNARRRPFRKAF